MFRKHFLNNAKVLYLSESYRTQKASFCPNMFLCFIGIFGCAFMQNRVLSYLNKKINCSCIHPVIYV